MAVCSFLRHKLVTCRDLTKAFAIFDANSMLSIISFRNLNGQHTRRPWREIFLVRSRLRGSDDD